MALLLLQRCELYKMTRIADLRDILWTQDAGVLDLHRLKTLKIHLYQDTEFSPRDLPVEAVHAGTWFGTPMHL
jgi:hypothetical protein